jgi:hypothetical protein
VPDLEVAVLARTNGRRAFRRIDDDETAELLGAPAPVESKQSEQPAPSEELPAAEELGTPRDEER